MTNSEDEQGMPFGTYEDYLQGPDTPEPDTETDITQGYASLAEYRAANPDPILGVLTGQYPARTMPIAMSPEDAPDDDGSA